MFARAPASHREAVPARAGPQCLELCVIGHREFLRFVLLRLPRRPLGHEHLRDRLARRRVVAVEDEDTSSKPPMTPTR